MTNDEGIGDEILYGAFLGDFLRAHLIDDVTWEGSYLLKPTLQTTYLEGVFVPRRSTDRATFDQVLPACELPRETIHGYISYDFLRRMNLRAEYPTGRSVGLSWFSQNHTVGPVKSARLEDMAPLFKDNFVVNLQYGDTTAEQRLAGLPLYNIPGSDPLVNMTDFFTQVASCDVVVTTSNTTLHVAGAHGVPTYLLLPEGAGPWYWDDMPYGSVTVCRGKGEAWATQALEQALDRLGR